MDHRPDHRCLGFLVVAVDFNRLDQTAVWKFGQLKQFKWLNCTGHPHQKHYFKTKQQRNLLCSFLPRSEKLSHFSRTSMETQNSPVFLSAKVYRMLFHKRQWAARGRFCNGVQFWTQWIQNFAMVQSWTQWTKNFSCYSSCQNEDIFHCNYVAKHNKLHQLLLHCTLHCQHRILKEYCFSECQSARMSK